MTCNDDYGQLVIECCKSAKLYVPEREVLVDNGAMIAWNGILKQQAGDVSTLTESRIDQRFRADQERVSWVKTE